MVNNVSFIPPDMPVLLQILGGNRNANSLLPKGSVYDLPYNKVIEVHINGGTNHPMHLHGANFWVVRAFMSFPVPLCLRALTAKIKSAGSQKYNYENPVQRDVVSTGADTTDEVVFRFVTDNPGPWFLHCHIDWHLQDGLAAVFATDERDVPDIDPPNGKSTGSYCIVDF